jgi:hypothetical protein
MKTRLLQAFSRVMALFSPATPDTPRYLFVWAGDADKTGFLFANGFESGKSFVFDSAAPDFPTGSVFSLITHGTAQPFVYLTHN